MPFLTIAFDTEHAYSALTLNQGGYIGGNGSLSGGTVMNLGGTLAITNGNFSVQKFAQTNDGTLEITFTSSGSPSLNSTN